MRKNHHVIVPVPGADPRACARVERTTALVDEILDSPEAQALDPTITSLAIHIASGWLGERCGFEAPWEDLDAKAFATALPGLGYFSPVVLPQMRESLCVAFDWMAAHGQLSPAAAARNVELLRAHWPAATKLPSPMELLQSLARRAFH